jgi:exonuclease III
MIFMVEQLKKRKTIAAKNYVKICHQNICGLRNKYNEILCHLEDITPQILCLTEHHLREEEIAHLNLKNYTLGAYYCWKNFMKGGTCI